MAETKTKSTRLSPKEKKAAQAAAFRKARIQWAVLAGVLVVIAIAIIVLISVFTEGSLPQQYDPSPA